MPNHDGADIVSCGLDQRFLYERFGAVLDLGFGEKFSDHPFLQLLDERKTAEQQPVAPPPVFPNNVGPELLRVPDILRQSSFHSDNHVVACQRMHGSIPQKIGSRIARPQDGDRLIEDRCRNDACSRTQSAFADLSGQKETVDGTEFPSDRLWIDAMLAACRHIGKKVYGEPGCFGCRVVFSYAVRDGKERRLTGYEERVRVGRQFRSGMRRIAVDDRGRRNRFRCKRESDRRFGRKCRGLGRAHLLRLFGARGRLWRKLVILEKLDEICRAGPAV